MSSTGSNESPAYVGANDLKKSQFYEQNSMLQDLHKQNNVDQQQTSEEGYTSLSDGSTAEFARPS